MHPSVPVSPLTSAVTPNPCHGRSVGLGGATRPRVPPQQGLRGLWWRQNAPLPWGNRSSRAWIPPPPILGEGGSQSCSLQEHPGLLWDRSVPGQRGARASQHHNPHELLFLELQELCLGFGWKTEDRGVSTWAAGREGDLLRAQRRVLGLTARPHTPARWGEPRQSFRGEIP